MLYLNVAKRRGSRGEEQVISTEVGKYIVKTASIWEQKIIFL